MKLRITVLIVFLTLFVIKIQSQVCFVSTKAIDMRTLADSIVSNTKRNYVYKSNTEMNKYSYSIDYTNVENDQDILSVHIKVLWKNENSSLEEEGIPEYNFSYVEAPYLDLCHFWEKFINENEDISLLSKKGHTFIFKDGKRFLFRKSSNGWTIAMKDIL